MKISRLTIAAALLALAAAFTACKPSEKNYRQAYERTLEGRGDGDYLDSTIYNKFRVQGRPAFVTVGADTLHYRIERIGYTKGEGATPSTAARYQLIVGQFKQIFNAREMRRRMIDGGYKNAFIIQTGEPLYYVAALSEANAPDALKALDKLRSRKDLGVRDPFPWVLVPSYLNK